MIVGNYQERAQIEKEIFTQLVEKLNDKHYRQYFCRWFLKFNTLLLDGHGRMQLTQEQQGGNLQLPPSNSLSALFRDDKKELKLEELYMTLLVFILLLIRQIWAN